MLPKVLYELLPYLYVSVAVSSGLTINSPIVFIASVVLTLTGVLVIKMRINYRRDNRRFRCLEM